MKFGVSIFPTQHSATPADVAREAERLGFESFFVSEHSHIPVSTEFPLSDSVPMVYRSMLDPFVALAAAAAVTQHIKVGTAICIVPQRDPINCAKLVSSIDQLSCGRMVFGVGAGWNPPEMENHRVSFAHRFAVMRERIEAMKCLWTQDEAEYHGRHVNISRSWQWPKPVQRPHPPILVAGAGEGVLKRVVTYGDGWMPVFIDEWHESMRNKMVALAELPLLIRKQRQLESELSRARTSITAMGLRPTPQYIETLSAHNVERMVLGLPSEGTEQVFAVLHAYAAAIAAYRD